MKISPSPETKDKLIRSLEEQYSQERIGIHVSDLTLCLRQSAYRKLNPKAFTSQTLSFFLDGQRRDLLLKSLYPEEARTKNVNGVAFTPDGIDEYGNPIESKATRSNHLGEPSKHYLTQLCYYIALMGTDKGKLIIQHISRASTDPFEVLEVSLESLERQEILNQIESKRQNLVEALEKKDASLAMHVLDDKELNWLCKSCQYKPECFDAENIQDGREPEE